MIIFRFSTLILCIFFLGCSEAEVAQEAVLNSGSEERIEIKKSGKPFYFNIFAVDYLANPNVFAKEFFSDDFLVSGYIEKLELFPTGYDYSFGEGNFASEPAYHIPLRGEDPDFWRLGANYLGSPVTIIVSMEDFSREKAALLELGERINVHCNKMRAPIHGKLVFETCVQTEVPSNK